MKLALFDLDNTLLAGDSDFEWAQFLITKGVLDREVHEARNREFYEHYKAGTLDIHAFLDFQLKPLGRHPRSQLETWHREFLETRIRPMITDKARALVREFQQKSDQVAIITATNRFVTAPIAKEFGVEHLIATEVEEIEGRYTGRGAGIPCFKEHKVTRLEMWLSDQGLLWEDVTESWFYSDSLNDLPLLSKVTHPVAVDPDDTLEAHARLNGWPIISLRG
jgi:HAD superfamily hydrolase (TIGR01490 family)